MIDQVGNEGAGARGRVQDLHVIVGQGLAEVLPQQVVGAPDDEVHHLVGGIDHAQAVGGGGIVGFIKILVDGLEELLLFGVFRDFIGGPPDGPVVGAQPVNGLPPHVAGKEGPLQGLQVPGDVVLPVELVFINHPQKNILGQDVLQQHFPHVGL